MSEATYIVYWPGQDTLACAVHAAKLIALGRHMGITVSYAIWLGDGTCANCENEERTRGVKNQDVESSH